MIFDRTTLDWRKISLNATQLAPVGRYYHGMAFLFNHIYVFGGWGKSGQ